VQRGGIIVTILIILNIIGFSIMLWKFISLNLARKQKEKIAQDILNFVKKHNQILNKELLQNALDIHIQKLEYGLGTVKIIATVAPLLGLLGTVIGILNTFDAISKQGLGNSSVFSGSISMALITTVAGLIVAIPHYIGYNYFTSLLDTIELETEKKVLENL
jgi:biopolymer transport protein ExbB